MAAADGEPLAVGAGGGVAQHELDRRLAVAARRRHAEVDVELLALRRDLERGLCVTCCCFGELQILQRTGHRRSATCLRRCFANLARGTWVPADAAEGATAATAPCASGQARERQVDATPVESCRRPLTDGENAARSSSPTRSHSQFTIMPLTFRASGRPHRPHRDRGGPPAPRSAGAARCEHCASRRAADDERRASDPPETPDGSGHSAGRRFPSPHRSRRQIGRIQGHGRADGRRGGLAPVHRRIHDGRRPRRLVGRC